MYIRVRNASPVGIVMHPPVLGMVFLLSSTIFALSMWSVHKGMEDLMNQAMSPPFLDSIMSLGCTSYGHLWIYCIARRHQSSTYMSIRVSMRV